MDNSNVQPDHGQKTHPLNTLADVASAKLAWEAWQSNDPNRIDSAIAERQRLLKEDPKAWKRAMHEIDEHADVVSAKAAWEAWQSNDPERVDFAIAEKQRLLKQDPKAWKIAMHEIDQQADLDSAKAAWQDWQSNDAERIDHALAEKRRLLKEDPKAWHKAMDDIDEEQRQVDAQVQLQREIQAEQAEQVAPPKQEQDAQTTILPTITLGRPADIPGGAVTQPYTPVQ